MQVRAKAKHLTILAALLLPGAAQAGSAPLVTVKAFADKNDNGVFDGNDVDLTAQVADRMAAFSLESADSLVLAGDIPVNCDECWSSVKSAKRITFTGSISLPRKGGPYFYYDSKNPKGVYVDI